MLKQLSPVASLIRSITLFPILRDNHFVLLVFRRETLQLTLYDSIENNNDRLLHEVHDRFRI